MPTIEMQRPELPPPPPTTEVMDTILRLAAVRRRMARLLAVSLIRVK